MSTLRFGFIAPLIPSPRQAPTAAETVLAVVGGILPNLRDSGHRKQGLESLAVLGDLIPTSRCGAARRAMPSPSAVLMVKERTTTTCLIYRSNFRDPESCSQSRCEVQAQMEAILDAIQDVVAAEPTVEAPPVSAQPDDAVIETQLAQEISTLWSDHARLSADRKVTSKELRLLRARLAQRLHEMKTLLARPGRGGEWRGWLRERGIPRSSADRLVARYSETLGSGNEGNVPTEAIPEPAMPTAEKLAAAVWSSSLKKVLVTGESVFQFLASIVQISGIPHERRQEGLMIFSPVPRAADGVTGTGVSTEAACPAPQATDGDGNLADTSAAEPAQQPSGETPGSIEQPAAEAAATPTEAGQAPAVADAGNGGTA